MTQPQSVAEIDLTPDPSRSYFYIEREWREEFIYFLLVDRFHDEKTRTPKTGPERSKGITTPDNAFYGGKIKGITNNLDYIAGLGCTAIWLSPVFANNDGAYHGYNIQNYLDIDPNFGTKQDLIDLVQAAHNFRKDGKPHPLRVILDVVINHSGDNWYYPNAEHGSYDYCNGQRFDLGGWREKQPIPTELRNPDFYHRMGNMNNYDQGPENQYGDMCGLKDYANDDDAMGAQVIDVLSRIHAYWIKETDVDGFRVDAIKHMGALACSRFCSNVREYAYSLGKRRFFLFGELAVPGDDVVDRYIGPNTASGDQTVFFGIDSVLDFPLAEGKWNDPVYRPLRDILIGAAGPQKLFNRLENQRQRALSRGELGRYLVTFVDNHDSFWMGCRVGTGVPEERVIASVGFLLCALGTPCIYYGTEQGFEGQGSDNAIREAMFDKNGGGNFLNRDCRIYQGIAQIAGVMRSEECLRFGRMYYREISGNGIDFGIPYGFGTEYTLAFSRLLYGSEVLVAYNVSGKPRSDAVIVDATVHAGQNATMTNLYGATGKVKVESAGPIRFVRLDLEPYQFVILK